MTGQTTKTSVSKRLERDSRMTQYLRYRRSLVGVFAGVVIAVTTMVAAGPAFALPPIVIGQSLPISAADPSAGRAIREGAEAYVRHVNENGGIGGRPLKLITLDDGGDVEAYRHNLRRLMAEERAVAIINCLGDLYCSVAADIADAFGVPVVGAMSGSAELRARTRNMFHTRAGYALEVESLARQLRTLGVQTLAHITEHGRMSEQGALVRGAFAEAGIAVESFELASPRHEDIEKALASIGGRFDAATLDVSADTYFTLGSGNFGGRREWPAIMTTLAGPSVRLLARTFRGRMVGFTMVVPNPEGTSIPLVREFQRNVDKYVAGSAVSFEGLESYINALICVTALKRTQSPTASELMRALGDLREADLGGFKVRVGGQAAQWVDVGVVSRDGSFMN